MPQASTGAPAGPQLSRRRALIRGGQGLLALTVLGAAIPACGSDQVAEPDPLEAELAAARADAALATAAAQAVPALAPALRVIADERTRHAAALVEELARAAGRPTPDPESPSPESPSPESPDPAATATATVGQPRPAGPPPTVGDVAEALRRSADSAAKLVPTLSGYRAGLLGSIAASCTASHTVGLPPARRPR